MNARRAITNVALIGGALTLIMYMLTLTQVHTYDAYSYAMTVQSKTFAETLHPHHLFYGPLGKAAFRFAQVLGYDGSAFLPLQVVNAFAGSFGVMALIALLLRATGAPFLALTGAGIVGFGFAWWRYAIEVEVYTVATLFLILATSVLIRIYHEPHSVRDWLLLGLLHALAIMFHQTNVLWAVVVLCVWRYATWDTYHRRERLPYIGSYIGVGAGLTIFFYAIAMYSVSDFQSWDEAQNWFFDYATTGFWGGVPSLTTLLNMLQGWSETWLVGAGWLVLIILIGIIVFAWRQLWVSYRPYMIICLSWLVPYVLFFGWWEADNIEFWIACTPPLMILAILGLATLPSALDSKISGALVLLLASLVLVNGWWMLQHGNRANDPDRQAVEGLVEAGEQGDLYVVPNGLQSLYLLNEYGRPNTFPLSLQTGDWQAACATIQASIEQTLSAGFAIWIAQDVLQPPPALLERYQLDPQAVQACFAMYAQAPQTDVGAHTYAVLTPLPAGQPNWRWQNWSFGWLINDSQALQANETGLILAPGADLHLVSPPLELQANDWSQLEVTLATTMSNAQAQFFWVAPNTTATEAASVRWELISDGEFHTYSFDLTENPQWQGVIERLRIDPVQQGAGTVTLQQLRLIP